MNYVETLSSEIQNEEPHDHLLSYTQWNSMFMTLMYILIRTMILIQLSDNQKKRITIIVYLEEQLLLQGILFRLPTPGVSSTGHKSRY